MLGGLACSQSYHCARECRLVEGKVCAHLFGPPAGVAESSRRPVPGAQPMRVRHAFVLQEPLFHGEHRYAGRGGKEAHRQLRASLMRCNLHRPCRNVRTRVFTSFPVTFYRGFCFKTWGGRVPANENPTERAGHARMKSIRFQSSRTPRLLPRLLPRARAGRSTRRARPPPWTSTPWRPARS